MDLLDVSDGFRWILTHLGELSDIRTHFISWFFCLAVDLFLVPVVPLLFCCRKPDFPSVWFRNCDFWLFDVSGNSEIPILIFSIQFVSFWRLGWSVWSHFIFSFSFFWLLEVFGFYCKALEMFTGYETFPLASICFYTLDSRAELCFSSCQLVNMMLLCEAPYSWGELQIHQEISIYKRTVVITTLRWWRCCVGE